MSSYDSIRRNIDRPYVEASSCVKEGLDREGLIFQQGVHDAIYAASGST